MSDEKEKKIFATNLNYYMNKNNKTQTDIIVDLGINKSTISTWCNGTKMPRMGTIQRLADYFRIKKSDLLEEKNHEEELNIPFDNIFPITTKKFPLLGEIACGEPIFAEEERESYILAGTEIKADFCLRAKGDSMINARILDGDIVFIRRQDMVNNGEIAAVAIGDEVTLKRVVYYPEKEMILLKAENPKYEDFIYIGNELEQIRILGKAVAFQSDVN